MVQFAVRQYSNVRLSNPRFSNPGFSTTVNPGFSTTVNPGFSNPRFSNPRFSVVRKDEEDVDDDFDEFDGIEEPAAAFGEEPDAAFGEPPAAAFGEPPAAAFGEKPVVDFGEPVVAFGEKPPVALGEPVAGVKLASTYTAFPGGDEPRPFSEAEPKKWGDSAPEAIVRGANQKLLRKVGIDLSGRAVVLVRQLPKNAPFRVRVGCQTRKGSDAMVKGVAVRKKNQDSFAALLPYSRGKKAEEWTSFFGVYDGHGKDGHSVSLFVNQAVANRLKKLLRSMEPAEALAHSVAHANDDLKRCRRIDSLVSGSTGVMVLQVGTDLYCCNVGDSRCVLGRNFGGKNEAVILSYDHKPDRPSESRRITRSGGRVQTYIPYDPTGTSSSSRVWVSNGKRLGPGLAVARAFGDFLFSSSGVVAVPEITKLKLSLWDYFVVLASDGVYSVMSSADVVEAAFTSLNVNKSPTEVAAEICAEAKRRWLLTDEGDRDDITCVVVFLETAQPRLAEPTPQGAKVVDGASG